ncbi:11274_t:CDS:2, partial [Acaulospora colombiana]
MDVEAPQNGRKRRRSAESKQAGTRTISDATGCSLEIPSHTKTALANIVTSNTSKRAFAVFDDADHVDEGELDMPRKKARRSSTVLQEVSPRILNTGGTQGNQLPQSTRAMLLSSLNDGLMSPLPQPPNRSLPKARNDENRPVSTLLGSPFRPTLTKSRQSSHSNRLKRGLLHHPSDGAIPRYPIFKRDQHRRPSDIYVRVRRDSSLSYKKHLSPPKKPGLKRDDSLWANLQQSTFKTPPKRQESLDSLLIASSDATILPIPHEPIHLDTPPNETDQL